MTLLASLVALVLIAQQPAPTISSAPIWLDDLAEATTLARESGRPLLIVFR